MICYGDTSTLYDTTGRKPVTAEQDMAVLNLSENKEQRTHSGKI